jgi:hypothetical protein
MVSGTHPWLLVGPWYRWPAPGVPATGRTSAPFIQKYETADFVNEFLKNPQHSLAFLESEDRVFEVTPRVPPLPLLKGKHQSFSDNVMQSTGIRKLFLDTHKRFYLVVCELHCDTAGFPTVDRNEICEAGFVVRRRYVQIPKHAEKHLRGAIRKGSTARQLQVLAADLGVDFELQGWISDGFDRVGSWKKVEETPVVNNTETIHPLYPLIPDPRLAKHAGKGRNIYFGVIPTGGADTDKLGNARFDDRNLYEIRCFVRRHKFPCPKKKTRNDCHGQLVWSERTEQFQLASHFDLAGTSNRPVSIQMPDLPALEAQVAADPSIGRKAPIKMISPKKSSLETKGGITGLKALGPPGAGICSFSIPLVTIVATFVFKLFLPIVVLIFQLWWMLALKFCIPPSFTLSLAVAQGLSAHTDPDGDKPEEKAFADQVKEDIGTPANLGADAVNNSSNTGLDDLFSPGVQAAFAANLSTDFSADLPADIPVDPPNQLDPNHPVPPELMVTGHLPSITDNLQFLPEVPLP